MTVSTIEDINEIEQILAKGQNGTDKRAIDIAQLDAAFSGSTFDALLHACQRHGDKTALSFLLSGDHYQNPVKISYRKLAERLIQTANMFTQAGLSEKDVIAYVLPNLPETHYTLWGGEGVAKVLAINPLLEENQMKELLLHSQAKAVVTLAPFPDTDIWEKVERILPDLPNTQKVFMVDVAHHVTGIKGQVAKLLQWNATRKIERTPGKEYIHFQSSLDQQSAHRLLSHRVISEQDTASLFCTGGTTGLPKIAQHSHANELANAKSIALVAGDIMKEGSVILCGLPLFHVNAAIVTGLTAFINGCEVVLMTPQGFRGKHVFQNFWKIIEHFGVNTFSAVPTVYSTLLQQPVGGSDIKSLKMALCGAAPMPVEVFKAFERVTGVEIVEGYGLTEGTCASSITPPNGKKKVGSIGLRLPTQQMRNAILDEEGQFIRFCGVDEVGVLMIRGKNVFNGYLNDEHNQGIWVTDNEQNIWLNTGDLARQDTDQYFWLAGRKKELIVRGGHNIEPKLIEEAIVQHPIVSLAAAIGSPDAHAGEVPVVYIQLKEEFHTQYEFDNRGEAFLSPKSQTVISELERYINANIHERAAIPKRIILCKQLPLTAVGKIFKPELEMREIANVIVGNIKGLAENVNHEAATKMVNVTQHKSLGIVADLDVKDAALKTALKSKLAPYTFKHQFVGDSSSQ